jgi:hypothetical protein
VIGVCVPVKKIIVFLLITAGIAVVIFLLCLNQEKKIRSVVDRGAAAIEHESIEEIEPLVSKRYRDEYGLSYMHVLKLFTHIFEQFDSLDVGCTVRSIIVERDSAIAVVDVDLRGKILEKREYIVGSAFHKEPLELTLKRTLFRWKVIRAHWVRQQMGVRMRMI